MSDSILEENLFYKYLKENLQENLTRWLEPYWIICVPENSVLEQMDSAIYSGAFAASQTLNAVDDNRLQFTSELFGPSLLYEISGNEQRSIIWQEECQNEIVVSKAVILKEYLIGYKDRVLHVALTDRLLPSMIEEDRLFMPELNTVSVASNKEGEEFLRRFRSHAPVISWVETELAGVRSRVIPTRDVERIQSALHGIILQAWDFLIRRHLVEVQISALFQDLLFRALDFFAVGFCHCELWNQVLTRCRMADRMVKSRLSLLHSSDISPSQLGLPKDLCAPLPAAVVEMASISGKTSAIEMLHCVRDSIEFIEAETKEAKAQLYQYTGMDPSALNWRLNEEEIVTLMMFVLVRAQCYTLVANIYYMTHYVFSVTDELHPLWKSLSVVRRGLERIMKLDVNRLPPATHTLQRELSLQDLMQVSASVESLFESRSRANGGSQSASDITTLDLQLKNLTNQIRLSTEAHSETHLEEENSPSRRQQTYSPSFSPPSFRASPSRVGTFVDLLASIPSNIRASFRRRQNEKRTAIQAAHSGLT